jgi:four helix bundle protein
MGDYRKLHVWQASRELTKSVYEATRTFPRAEMLGLAAQLRNASISIGANLAEGFGRPSSRDTARFIGIAIGSANEVEQHLTTAIDVGYLAEEDAAGLQRSVEEIRRMLTALHQTVRARGR